MTLDDPKFHPGENFPFSDFGTILLFFYSLQDKNSKTLQTLSYYLHPEWLQLVFVFWTICQINTVSQAICMLGSSFPLCQTREDQCATLAWD